MFKEFHHHGELMKGLNSSFIILISKKDEVSNLFDFQSKSLIGAIYKLSQKFSRSDSVRFWGLSFVNNRAPSLEEDKYLTVWWS